MKEKLFFLVTGLIIFFFPLSTGAVFAQSINLVDLTIDGKPSGDYPHFFYSPNIIYENGKYRMWATVDDKVSYFASSDGINWVDGQTVLSPIQTSWENDGNCSNGTCGGISEPRVVKNVTPGWESYLLNL